jgi:hypothetical protein
LRSEYAILHGGLEHLERSQGVQRLQAPLVLEALTFGPSYHFFRLSVYLHILVTANADIQQTMSLAPASINILIFKGEPLDYQRYRHTSLHISFPDEQDPFVAHAVGPPGEYEFQVREPYDSSELQGLVRTVKVGNLSTSIAREQLIEILRAVQVRNWDVEFNCQIWVEAALRRLRDLRILSGEAYTEGVDGMVNAIAEAEDEEE